MKDIFYTSHAKYKLWWKDKFVVFSPEIFVRIENGEITSYPMKGTIDADLPDAERKILNDEKEMAEHATMHPQEEIQLKQSSQFIKLAAPQKS